MRLPLQWLRPSRFLHSPFFLGLLFILALLPRLVALGQYITPDELNWVHRSVQFHRAILAGAWADTLTTGHPGVITTWAGALGIQIQLWLRPSDMAAYEWITKLAWLAPENTAAFPQLATFLSAGRAAVAALNSLGLVAIFGLARRLVSHRIAVGFAMLLALDPFVAGLSGLLHVDGLMMMFATISLLALAAVLQNLERQDWWLTAVSGAAAGCAILAKSAALTLLSFVGLAFFVGLIVWRKQWQKVVQLGLVWLLAAIATQFLLLPALWNQPVAVYQTVLETIFHEAEEVLPQTFFLGQHAQAHGNEFYPIALLYRLNPVVFVGLLVGGWYGLRRKWPVGWWQRPLPSFAFLWPIFFIAALTIATKKFDRYLLPALPMLFLLSAAGWEMLFRQRPSWAKRLTVIGGAAAFIYLVAAIPYLLNAYNPIPALLLPTKDVMPLGWGEAVSASAQWLAEQPDAAEKTAVAGIAPSFAPFFPGQTLLRDGENRLQADFVVETLAGFQANHFRIIPSSDLRLLHTIRYDGQEQAWIYANDNPVRPQIERDSQNYLFDEQIQLLASGIVAQDEQLNLFVQWQLGQPVDGRFNVQIRLLDEAGYPWSQTEMPLLNETYFYPENWQMGEPAEWRYPLQLPPGLPPANYRIEISLFDAEGGGQLPVFAADGRFAGVALPLSELELVPPALLQTELLNRVIDPQPILDEKLLLLDVANLPETVVTAQPFSLDLFWQSTAVLPNDLHIQFFADNILLETLPLSRYQSARWQEGQVIHEKYQIAVPPELANDVASLHLGLADADGRSLSNKTLNLGTINITVSDRLFSLPENIAQPLALQFGDLASLRGYDLATSTAAPGEPVNFTLYWQVGRQPTEILSTFVHLVAADGRIITQGDQWPGGLPSNSWVAEQVIIDEYSIVLPEDAPEGLYQIVLGLYAPASGLRLPIFAEDGQEIPNDQFILPGGYEIVQP